jgi:phosphoglycolate phosphatase
MKSHKETTWMIGDTCLDMVSAKDAGINYIGVKFDYENEDNLKKCAEIIKKDVLDAVKYIRLKRERN